MLSATFQASASTSRTTVMGNSAAPVAGNPVTDPGVNHLQEKNSGRKQQAELFSGQLGDVLAGSGVAASELAGSELVVAELAGPELVGSELVEAKSVVTEPGNVESPTTGNASEQITLQNPDQPGFEHQRQQQEQPDAEAWLQAMLDQQQLQLQARDSDLPAVSNVAVAVVTPMAVEVNPVAQAATTTAAFVQVAQPASAVVREKPSYTNFASNALGGVVNQQQVQSDQTTQSPVSAKTFDSVAQTMVTPPALEVVANTLPAADVLPVDESNTATRTAAAISSSAASIAHLAATAISETTTSESISSGIASATLTTSGVDAQRSVQSQLSLHAPEAKWGEQLLHALRDNVQVQIQQKIQNATIRLDPPELGSLEIYLSHESGRLQVQITASQADVARLIQSTSDRLRHELSGPQFTQVNIQTSTEGQSGQQQSRERQRLVNDELILANEQPLAGNDQHTRRSGDVLVTV